MCREAVASGWLVTIVELAKIGVEEVEKSDDDVIVEAEL